MEDALNERKWLLAVSLLNKLPAESMMRDQQDAPQKSTLWHVLAKNSKECPHNNLEAIANAFLQRKIDSDLLDEEGDSVLHICIHKGN